MEGKCACVCVCVSSALFENENQIILEGQKMKKENGEQFSRLKENSSSGSRLYIVSWIFLKWDFYWIALDWIGCRCRANSPSETMGELFVSFISLRFTHQRRQNDEKTTPATTRNQVEKSSIKWKRKKKKTTTFFILSHTHSISVETHTHLHTGGRGRTLTQIEPFGWV